MGRGGVILIMLERSHKTTQDQPPREPSFLKFPGVQSKVPQTHFSNHLPTDAPILACCRRTASWTWGQKGRMQLCPLTLA